LYDVVPSGTEDVARYLEASCIAHPIPNNVLADSREPVTGFVFLLVENQKEFAGYLP